MSRIDDLVADLCPDGVAFARLGDIATTVSGLTGKTKSDFSDGNARYVSYKNAFANLAVDQNAPEFVKLRDGERQNRLHQGDVVITGSSESLDEVGMSSVVTDEPTEALYLNSFCFVIRLRDAALLTPGFSKYLFRSSPVRAQIRRSASGVTRINISKGRFMNTRIPIPPLEVQREIVGILDAFTELEVELEAELAARRQQRRALASNFFRSGRFHSGAERIALGRLAKQHIETVEVRPHEQYVNLGVKWYGEGVFSRGSKSGSAIKGATLRRVRAGQLIFNRMFVVEGSFAVVPASLAHGVVSNEFPAYNLDTDRVLPDWLLHYLLDEYTLERVSKEVTGVERGSTKSRRRWKEEQFEAFEVDLPPVETQRQVLDVLGGVRKLEKSLSAELAARRRQYEHYRDRLLTFREVSP